MNVFIGDKETKLFSSLWKRDRGLCFLCETSLAEELTRFEGNIEVHHILPFAEGGSNRKKVIWRLVHHVKLPQKLAPRILYPISR